MIELNNADYLLDDEDNEQIQEEEVQEPVLQSDFLDPTDNVEAEQTEEVHEPEESPEGLTVMEAFLQSHGISDPSNIQYEDEDGNIVTKNFNDLDAQEQYNILEEIVANDLSEDENQVIGYMRSNNKSFGQILEEYAASKVEAYKQSIQEDNITYSIDEFTDDQLYFADFRSKHPDFTDEEILDKLEAAKANEALYQREVNDLRKEYKQLEDTEREAAAAREQREYEDMRNNLAQAVGTFNAFALDYADPQSDSLVIEDVDKQQMLSYILDQDAEGKSQLVRDLEDPNALSEIALWRTKGADFLAESTRYYKSELAKAHKEISKLKGQLEKSSSKSTVVVEKKAPSKQMDSYHIGNYFDKLL